jgi:ribonuclease J
MTEDLERSDCLEDAKVLYSMWPGYLELNRAGLRKWCQEHGIGFEIVHTSGHATANGLKRLVSAVKPKELIPIHTVAPNEFDSMGAKVRRIKNGHWANVKWTASN